MAAGLVPSNGCEEESVPASDGLLVILTIHGLVEASPGPLPSLSYGVLPVCMSVLNPPFL